MAHRGGGTLAPENTLAAMREAVARGYRAVEFDVMLTADDVPVLMHDEGFGRTIAGRGRVAEVPYAELAARDAGMWFSPRYRGESVPRYEDVVRFCVAHDLWMNVEIKPAAGREAITGRIVGEATRVLLAERDGRALFSSFDAEALEAARTTCPDAPRGMLFERLPPDAAKIARALDCISVHVAHHRLGRDGVATLHDAGFAVMAYTVNESSRVATLDAWGVDAICTDRLDLIDATA